MRRPSELMLALWLVVIPLIISCTSSLPAQTPAAPGQAQVKAVADDYIIGPGDTVHVFVWLNPELSVTVPVRPDGKISTPLVEDMVAVGKTPPKLARDLEGVLAEGGRAAKVNTLLLVALSVYSQVSVIGQVKEPQALPYHEG